MGAFWKDNRKAAVGFLLFLLGSSCVKRSGEFFTARYPSTGENYLLVTIETASGNGKVVSFFADMSSGLLTEKSVVDAEISPRALALSPLRNAVYVGNYTSGSISVYSLNRSNGGLELIQTVTGVTQVSSLVSQWNASVIYAGFASGVQPYTVSSDGLLTALGAATSVGGAVHDLEISPAYNALYANRAGDSLVTLTIPSAGSLAVGGTLGFTSIADIHSRSSSTGIHYLFVADSGANAVNTFTIDATTGALTASASLSVAAPVGVEFYRFVPATLLVQLTGGAIMAYSQAADGSLTLYKSNSEVSDTVAGEMNMENVNVKLFTLGTGGIYSWEQSVSTAVSLKLRRSTSLAGYGLYANSMLGIPVQ